MAFNHYPLMLSAVLCFAGPALSKIMRPCALDDYECMGINLAANSKCNPNVTGEIPAAMHGKIWHFEAPFFNTSYIDRKLIARNVHKCSIAEFFVNTKTKRTVIGIECRNLRIDSHRTSIKHRTFKEDRYHHYHVEVIYPLLRVTVNLPLSTDMDLCSAYIYTDVVKLPEIRASHLDKHTRQGRDQLSNLYIFEREICSQRAIPIAYCVIEGLICDYGCLIPN